MHVSQALRRARLFLQFDPGPRRAPRDFRRAAVEVVRLARFHYLFILFLIHTGRFTQVIESGPPTDPLWPVALLNRFAGAEWAERTHGLPFIPVAGAAVGLSAALFPGALICRLGVFLHLLLFVALRNSYGFVNHGWHFLLYVSFALLLLPSGAGRPERMSRKDAMDCVMTFWFAQSIPLLAYSLSGFWKIWGSGLELLAPDGMTRILLDRMMEDTAPPPLLLPFMAGREQLAQLLLLGAVCVLSLSILVLFRPHLHRPWGTALILFHCGNDWLMNVRFGNHVLVVGLLLVFSPFAPVRFSWLGMAQSLPGLGAPFRRRRPSGSGR